MTYKISVILPVYKADLKFEACLLSLSKQTFDNFELIVIDDSTNRENIVLELVEKYFNTRYTILVNEINIGAGASRLKGVMKASGEYIAFIDSDDCWHPSKLEIQINLMLKFNSSISAHLYSTKFNPDLYFEKTVNYYFLNHKVLYFKSVISTPTLIIKKNQLIGLNSFRRCDDLIMIISSAINSKQKILFINGIPLAFGFKPNMGHSGLTGSLFEMHKAYVNSLLYLYKNQVGNERFFIFSSILFEYFKLPLRFLLIKSTLLIKMKNLI